MTEAIADFSPQQWGERDIFICGAGTVGSWIAVIASRLFLSQRGLSPNIHVFDGDRVEAHNPGNQAYGIADVPAGGKEGPFKVDALARIIERDTGFRINSHPYMLDEEVLGELSCDGVCFVAVDQMGGEGNPPGRLEIFNETELWSSMGLGLMVEARLDIEHGFVYAIDPGNLQHRDGWMKFWHPKREVETTNLDGGSCSTRRAALPLGITFAALCVAQWTKWIEVENHQRDEEDFYHRLMLDLYGNVLKRYRIGS